jgi:putative hemolysin
MAVAAPIDLTATLFRPVIWALSISTDGVMRIMGIRDSNSRESISGEELRGIVAAHEELSLEERELIGDVFDAGDRELREVMIPRTEVEFLDGAMSVQKAAEAVLDMRHTRYPVIRGSSDNVIGFVHLRDVVSSGIHKPTRLPLSSLARDVLVFPGTKQVLPALGEMRRAGGHLAIVLDEYGGTAGIVTLEDLVEELVGDIRDEYDATEQQSAFFGGVHEIDGLTNLEDVKDETGIELPEGPYETVAGYLIARTGQLPSLDMSVEVMGHRISVLELDGRRISRVRIEPLELRSAIPDESAALTMPE